MCGARVFKDEAFMGLTVAIQMDPIEKIDIGGDSTFALALEAQNRGHNLLYYGPRDLSFRDGKLGAHVRVEPDVEKCAARIEIVTLFYREPVIVQRYLARVRKGDNRVILVDGEFAGAINRVPAQGDARSNLHVGGRPEATELTTREK